MQDKHLLKQAIDERKTEIINNFDSKLQPFLIVVGEKEYKITTVYIYLNDVLYPITSVVKGISILFQFFNALNLEYPLECRQVWYFVEEYFYNISSTGPKSNDCISLITEMKETEQSDSD